MSSQPVFISRRADGFGERLRAMLNAMAASRLYPGTFRFSWPEAPGYMTTGNSWHSIRPVDKTFSPEFVEAWHISAEEVSRLSPARLATLSSSSGEAYAVEHVALDGQAPGVFAGWQEEIAKCFRDITFSSDLEIARVAAASIEGDFAEATALHLRAGDVVYGPFRKTGQFVGKVCPWPLADAISADLTGRGQNVILFGQDDQLIKWLSYRHGARSVADLMRDLDFDPEQQALFEICLMARCANIVCGHSGFSQVSAWIGQRPTRNPYSFFDTQTTRRILEKAGVAAPPDDGVSALQHAFACNAAIKLRGDRLLGDATGRKLLRRALEADPENDFFRILLGAADIRAGDAPKFEKRLHNRLAQGSDAVASVHRVVSVVYNEGVTAISPVLADIEVAARTGGKLAAWCAAWAHIASKDLGRAIEFSNLWDNAAASVGLVLPRPPRSPGVGRAFFGVPLPQGALPPEREHFVRLMKCLTVCSSPAELKAIGSGVDGTYLVPDDLDGVVACFSPGVNNSKHFEDALAEKYGIASHMCDASSDAARLRTPLIPGLQTFEKVWLDITGSSNAVSLDDWVSSHCPEAGDLILQMDIEGAEWRNLISVSDSTLLRFRVLVFELHGLNLINKKGVLDAVVLPVLERIKSNFHCVYIRANNDQAAVDIPGLDTPIPPLVEVTFLRRDRFHGRSVFPVELPHPLDIGRNVKSKAPLFVGDAFRGRPPTDAERKRIEQVEREWAQQQEITALKERIYQLESELMQSHDDRVVSVRKEENLNSRVRNLEKKVAQLDTKYRQSEAKAVSMVNSTSWRITVPLRWIGRSVRRLKATS